MKPTLVEAQSSIGYGKVPYTTSGPSKSTNTGDIRKNGYKNMILEIFWGQNKAQNYLKIGTK